MGASDWRSFLAALVCLMGTSSAGYTPAESRLCFAVPSDETIYGFQTQSLEENPRNVSLSEFRGKVLLVVNVATFWGFTEHYLGLNALKQEFPNLEIIGFPSNQFGLQEPGTGAKEIYNGIRYVRPGNNYVPLFPLMEKIDVNGEKEHPIYTFLKKYCPSTRVDFPSKSNLYYHPMTVRDLRWNWEKFLINKNGHPVLRYDPSTHPSKIKRDIEKLLVE